MKCKNCDSMEILAKGLCQKCYSKAHYEANKDKAKLYQEANKDEISAKGKLYHEANKDKINARSKLYYEANKDKIKLYHEATRDPNTARMGSEEHRINCSCRHQGIAIEDFNGFVTDQPYCYKFNESRKTKIRNKYNNCDYISGIHKSICNKGRSLDVHHVDYNKMQGCDDHQWKLIPLSRSNHSRTNTNRPFWNKLFIYSLEIDKCYYEVESSNYC